MGKIEAALARLGGKRVYIDANIFIYFLDGNERYLPISTALLQAARERQFFAMTGKAVVAEVMVHPYRLGNPEIIARFKQFFAQDFLTVVDHPGDLFDAASMYAGTRRMKLMDAFHYATALSVGCAAIVSNDTGLVGQAGIEVIGIDDLLSCDTKSRVTVALNLKS